MTASTRSRSISLRVASWVALAFVVPVTGTCEPRQDALELTWMTPAEAASDSIGAEMEGGRGTLVRAALASVGVLP